MTRRLRLGVLVATAALALAACSSSGATAAPASQPAASSAASAPAAPASAAAGGGCSEGTGSGTAAEIKDFTFPTGLSVASGSAISWTNGDSADHTVTLDDGSCNTPVKAGSTVTVTYSTPGTYAFHCTIHPQMTGSLEVK
jgi:plastocyanin